MYTRIETSVLKPGVASARKSPIALNGTYAIPVKGDGNGLIFEAEHESISELNVTVLAADNVFCGGDHVLNFCANCKSAMHFEGAPYVQSSGEYKGMILIHCEGEVYGATLSVMENI